MITLRSHLGGRWVEGGSPQVGDSAFPPSLTHAVHELQGGEAVARALPTCMHERRGEIRKALFLQANFGFGNSSDNLTIGGEAQNINTNILAVGAGPGFTIFSNDAIGLEALVKYNYARSKFDIDIAGVKTSTTTKTNQIALSLGLQIYFRGLRK